MAQRGLELLFKVVDQTGPGSESVKGHLSGVGEAITKGGENLESIGRVGREVHHLARGFVVMQAGIQAAGAGLDALHLGAAALSGDMKGVEEATAALDKRMQALPFGIGEVYKIGKEIRELFTGEEAELEGINRAIEAGNALYELRAKLIKGQKADELATAELRLKREGEAHLAGLEGTNKELAASRLETDVGLSKNSDEAIKERKNKIAEEHRAELGKLEKMMHEAGDAGGELTNGLWRSEKAAEILDKNPNASFGMFTEGVKKRVGDYKLAQLQYQQAKQAVQDDQDKAEKEMLERRAITAQAGADKLQGIEDKAAKDLRKLLTERGQETIDTREELAAKSLENQGRITEADVARINASYDKQIADTYAKANEAAKAHPEGYSDIQAGADAQGKLLEQRRQQDLDKARREGPEKEREATVATENRLQNDLLLVLQQQSELGDKGAAREVARLQTLQQYRGAESDLLKIIQDQRTTEEQRLTARQELAGLQGAESAAADAAGDLAAFVKGSSHLAPTEQNSHLTGVAEAYQTTQEDANTRRLTEIRQVLEQQSGFLENLLRYFDVNRAVMVQTK